MLVNVLIDSDSKMDEFINQIHFSDERFSGKTSRQFEYFTFNFLSKLAFAKGILIVHIL